MTEFIGGNVKSKKLVQSLALLGALATAVYSHAGEVNGIDFSGSGFLTLGAGKMMGGAHNNVSDYNCPCFIGDYAQAGVYQGDKEFQWKPDSKLGVQGTAAFDNRRYSITAQAVARGARDGAVNLEWLYGSYKLNDKITFQAGRKRLPMFYYSDTQDIGVALPWAHLPPQLYGWEAVNYNGVNMMYQDQWDGWSTTANLLAGKETYKDSGYWKIYNGSQNRTDVKWSNILGGDLTLSKDWLETRLVYIQSDTQTKNVNGTWDAATLSYDPGFIETEFGPAAKQQIYGIAINADYMNWLVRTEFIHINRPGLNFKDFAQIVGVGYRLGKWQPMLTWSRYKGTAVVDQGGDPEGQEGHATTALSLRYDLTTSSAVKMQIDSQRDQSGPNWAPNYGDARLLTFTYDMVF
ncbi:MAG: hypothetical protein WC091_18280 [Sulfuricellaceae bacterium]